MQSSSWPIAETKEKDKPIRIANPMQADDEDGDDSGAIGFSEGGEGVSEKGGGCCTVS